MMTDSGDDTSSPKEKYDELLKEISLLPSAETDELYKFCQQLNDQLIAHQSLTENNVLS